MNRSIIGTLDQFQILKKTIVTEDEAADLIQKLEDPYENIPLTSWELLRAIHQNLKGIYTAPMETPGMHLSELSSQEAEQQQQEEEAAELEELEEEAEMKELEEEQEEERVDESEDGVNMSEDGAEESEQGEEEEEEEADESD